jgi:hypothetical protein
MAKTKAKLSRIRITTYQSKLLPLRTRIRRRIVASCADLWIIGQRSVQIAKEENLNLSRRLRTWLYPALEMELVDSDASLGSIETCSFSVSIYHLVA